MAYTITTLNGSSTLEGTSGTDSTVLAATTTAVSASSKEGADNITFGDGGTGAAFSGTIGMGSEADQIAVTAASTNNVNGLRATLGDGADSFNDGGVAWTGFTNNTILGGGGADTITFGAGATGSNNLFRGGQGNDTFTVTLGANDSIQGGSEIDTFTVANGTNIFLNGQVGADVMTITTGTGTVRGGSEGDTMTNNGAVANLTMYGDKGNDVMVDGAGANSIFGGEGADQITAGTGADTQVGGAGNDIFSIAAGDGSFGTFSRAATGQVVAGDTIQIVVAVAGANATAVDTITDFGTGTNRINTANGIAAVSGLGQTVTTDQSGLLTAGGATAAGITSFFSGNYNSATGLFTITANGAGASTMIYTAGVATAATAGVANFTLLENFDSDNLAATSFF